MATSGAVYDLTAVGIVIEMRRTAADTGGAFTEFEVTGRPRGFFKQAHVHVGQTERHEVLQGTLRLGIDGEEHVLGPGDSMEVAPDTRHTQRPGGRGVGRVLVRLTPAGREEEFFARLAELCADGAFNRFGYPRDPVATARLTLDFMDSVHGATPPPAIQKLVAKAVLQVASREYVFVDKWDVAAPREAVFAAVSDGRTFPLWWRPVFIAVDVEGEPAVGKVADQHFKGRLPYHLHTRSTTTRLEPPHVAAADFDGDLRGCGMWTLTELPGGRTHVEFDWRVSADRPLLRVLTPLLRPAFRWNHAWSIARAIDGLEPYAQRSARTQAVQQAVEQGPGRGGDVSVTERQVT